MDNISRREFLKKFIPKKIEEPSHHNEEIEKNKINKEESYTLSRREFLAFLGALSVGMSSENVLGGMTEANADTLVSHEETKDNQEKDRYEEPARVYEPWKIRSRSKTDVNEDSSSTDKQDKEDPSYLESGVETTLLFIGEYLFTSVLDKIRVKNGNQGYTGEEFVENLKKDPVSELFMTTVVGPVVEEVVFRGLPSLVIPRGKDNRLALGIGIPSSVLFALVHNLKEGESGKTEIATDSIPVVEFLSGVFYWYLVRKKGLSHSMLAHSLHNSLGMSVFLILTKAYGDNPDEFQSESNQDDNM